jgi:hypothetical protein
MYIGHGEFINSIILLAKIIILTLFTLYQLSNLNNQRILVEWFI